MLFSSINRFSSRQFRSSSLITSALLLMDLGGVRLKMARKNCDRINAVKTVNGYVFLNVGTPYFFNVRKLYIDTYCISHAISIEHPSVGLTSLAQLRSRSHLKPHCFSPSLTNGDKSDEHLLQYMYLNMA